MRRANAAFPWMAINWLFSSCARPPAIALLPERARERFLTTAEVQIEMDNGALLNQTIYNFQRPTPEHSVSTIIGLHYDAPPAKVIEVLRAAAASVPGVLPERPPVVYLKNFGDSAIEYEICVRIVDHAIMNRVLSDVRAHCWYAVKRAGMEIPYPQMVLHRAPRADTGLRSNAARANGVQSVRDRSRAA